MKSSIAIFVGLIFLSSCGAYDTMTEGFKHSQEVATDIEKTVGSKPFVGFNWSNGSLASINLTFVGIPPEKPVPEIVSLARKSITARFKEEPRQIVISFSVSGSQTRKNRSAQSKLRELTE